MHPPLKVPVPLRETLKMEFNNLVKNGILAKITEPTSWVSSLVIVKKPNGKIRYVKTLETLTAQSDDHTIHCQPSKKFLLVLVKLEPSVCWMLHADSGKSD